jgi:hypothetical protein
LVGGAAGAFLPWVRSGSVLRNSYRTIGSIRNLVPGGDGPVGVLWDAWAGLPLLAAACVLLFLVGLRRTAAGFAVLFSAMAGTVSAFAVVQGGSSGSPVQIVLVGPVVTLGGAVLALVGAAGVFTASLRSARSRSGGES